MFFSGLNILNRSLTSPPSIVLSMNLKLDVYYTRLSADLGTLIVKTPFFFFFCESPHNQFDVNNYFK